MFICPTPSKWHEIFKRLKSAWEKDAAVGVKPPVPLILAGWNYSNDMEKKDRWDATVQWAKAANLEHLIGELSEDDSYSVDVPIYCLLPLLGLEAYPYRNFMPRDTPTDVEVKQALYILKERWNEIVGSDLGAVTTPLHFTGKKKRRLLVSAKSYAKPPWGTWFELYNNEKRRAFTYFRRAINDAISPLEVDHIDFEVE
jgi:hypothetical protein